AEEPCDRVERSARGVGNDEVDGLGGPGLRGGVRGEESAREGERDAEEASGLHARIIPPARAAGPQATHRHPTRRDIRRSRTADAGRGVRSRYGALRASRTSPPRRRRRTPGSFREARRAAAPVALPTAPAARARRAPRGNAPAARANACGCDRVTPRSP